MGVNLEAAAEAPKRLVKTREEAFALDPGLGEGAHDLARERLGAPLRLQRERQRSGHVE